jgi:hypothetical protein
MGELLDLPTTKWEDANEQVVLKEDLIRLEAATLASFSRRRVPSLSYYDAGTVKVLASADGPVRLALNGVPNLLHPGQFLSGALSNGQIKEITASVSCALTAGSTLWGAEAASQWYAIYALGSPAATTFSLKAMPVMRFKSENAQIISLGLNLTPASAVGYSFATDELAGGKIYVLSGTSRGQVRSITANNNSGSAGTITYSGTALSLAAGDWFIVLPPTNFRWLGNIFNNASGNIEPFTPVGNQVFWTSAAPMSCPSNSPIEDIRICCPLAATIYPRLISVTDWSGGTPGPFPIVLRGNTLLDAYLGTIEQSVGINTLGMGQPWMPLAFCTYVGLALAPGGSFVLTNVVLNNYGYEYPEGYFSL